MRPGICSGSLWAVSSRVGARTGNQADPHPDAFHLAHSSQEIKLFISRPIFALRFREQEETGGKKQCERLEIGVNAFYLHFVCDCPSSWVTHATVENVCADMRLS